MKPLSKTALIAPCGMNCGLCKAFLRNKNKCVGCRAFNAEKPVTIANCKIKNCLTFKKTGRKYCFECEEFPCDKLKHLDKRYRTKYGMSMIENLASIKAHGIRQFVRDEKVKWACPKCGGTICVHMKCCYVCGSSK